jgi:two-component system NtrC family response regulator
MADILIIDDDKQICNSISSVIKKMGHNAVSARTLREGLKKFQSKSFDVVFLDVRMPNGNGLDILPKIKEIPVPPEVIIITGFGNSDGAELAIDSGAWDYIEKPLSVREIKLPLIRALQYREEKTVEKPRIALNLEGIIGSSSPIKRCIDILAQAANSDANVLISGETGTGKELFAWAIHKNSRRDNSDFVVVDCAALPETLVESVLFGHIKGAFTGADRARKGLIKQADGGTLFLDEVGELAPSIQKSFLRVLQEHRFRPVGGSKEVDSDFRLIAATNRSIESMVKKGHFRKDLLFRLRTITMEISPLREHKEDIRELSVYYMARLCEKYGAGTKGFSPEFWDVLASYDWPGNVRELIQSLERALAAAQNEPTLFPKHLPKHIRIKVARASVSKAHTEMKIPEGAVSDQDQHAKLKDIRDKAIAEVEEKYLEELMIITGRNIKEACRISGLSRSRLYALLKKYQIF